MTKRDVFNAIGATIIDQLKRGTNRPVDACINGYCWTFGTPSDWTSGALYSDDDPKSERFSRGDYTDADERGDVWQIAETISGEPEENYKRDAITRERADEIGAKWYEAEDGEQ